MVNRRGRPTKPAGEKYETPVRKLRIADEEMEMMLNAAEQDGVTFSEWARKVLLRAAKRRP